MSSAAYDIFQRHRLTVAEYYRMGETGILAPDARVELIEGEVIDMPPIGSPHAGTVNYMGDSLRLACGGQAIVRRRILCFSTYTPSRSRTSRCCVHDRISIVVPTQLQRTYS